jgi:hypothetical protein
LIKLPIFFILLLALFVSSGFAQNCDPQKENSLFSTQLTRSPDRVTYLPGWGCVNDLELAGTLPIGKESTPQKSDSPRLFYWFVESRQHLPNTPLILWLNGGIKQLFFCKFSFTSNYIG